MLDSRQLFSLLPLLNFCIILAWNCAFLTQDLMPHGILPDDFLCAIKNSDYSSVRFLYWIPKSWHMAKYWLEVAERIIIKEDKFLRRKSNRFKELLSMKSFELHRVLEFLISMWVLDKDILSLGTTFFFICMLGLVSGFGGYSTR